MGQAEQRQVQTGVAERVRQQVTKDDAAAFRLGEIRRRRRELDDALRDVAGRERGLSADVGLTILGDDPPPDDVVAQAAGWTVEDVAALRARLLAPPADLR
jgi:hypothetical protein